MIYDNIDILANYKNENDSILCIFYKITKYQIDKAIGQMIRKIYKTNENKYHNKMNKITLLYILEKLSTAEKIKYIILYICLIHILMYIHQKK